MVSEEWIYFNVSGKPEAEAFILNKLLRLLANKGIGIDNIQKLNRTEAEAIKQWQAHGRKPEPYIITSLLLYLEITQAEEYNKAIQVYYDYINSFHLSNDVAEKQGI